MSATGSICRGLVTFSCWFLQGIQMKAEETVAQEQVMYLKVAAVLLNIYGHLV